MQKYGIPSHVHSCGPQKELVKIMAEETDLTIVILLRYLRWGL